LVVTAYNKAHRMSSTAYRLLRLLSESADEAGIIEMTQEEMASRLGACRRAVANAMKSLTALGLVSRPGNGIYLLGAQMAHNNRTTDAYSVHIPSIEDAQTGCGMHEGSTGDAPSVHITCIDEPNSTRDYILSRLQQGKPVKEQEKLEQELEQLQQEKAKLQQELVKLQQEVERLRSEVKKLQSKRAATPPVSEEPEAPEPEAEALPPGQLKVSDSAPEPPDQFPQNETDAWLSVSDAVAIWNETCSPPLPSVRTITPKRRQQLRARQREHPQLRTADGFREFCQSVAASPFLRGETGRDTWRGATFDWCLTPTYCVRIIEGHYAPPEQRSAQQIQSAFAWLERAREERERQRKRSVEEIEEVRRNEQRSAERRRDELHRVRGGDQATLLVLPSAATERGGATGVVHGGEDEQAEPPGHGGGSGEPSPEPGPVPLVVAACRGDPGGQVGAEAEPGSNGGGRR